MPLPYNTNAREFDNLNFTTLVDFSFSVRVKNNYWWQLLLPVSQVCGEGGGVAANVCQSLLGDFFHPQTPSHTVTHLLSPRERERKLRGGRMPVSKTLTFSPTKTQRRKLEAKFLWEIYFNLFLPGCDFFLTQHLPPGPPGSPTPVMSSYWMNLTR